jgi:protein-S-isoprenylcysteine O-methyltransferase Ste14
LLARLRTQQHNVVSTTIFFVAGILFLHPLTTFARPSIIASKLSRATSAALAFLAWHDARIQHVGAAKEVHPRPRPA